MNRIETAQWFRINRTTTLLISLVTSLLILSIAFVPSEPVAAQTPPDEQSANNESSKEDNSPDLLRKAEREGSVRVIVGLQVDFVPEGKLSRSQAADQRDAIRMAQTRLLADLQGTGFQILREYDSAPFIALKLTPRALEAVQRSPRVTSIMEDRPEQAALAESAPLVQAPSMWSNGYTGEGQTVAVLDTGVDRSHPFLAGKVVEEACFSGDNGSGPGPGYCPNGTKTQTGLRSAIPCTYAANDCKHGTHVAGIVAGKGTTFSGVARGAKIMAVQVFSQFTGSSCTGFGLASPCALTYPSDQIEALERVYDLRSTHDFSSVNMSIADNGQNFSNCDTDARKQFIDNLRSAGIATVIASGNNSYTNAISRPACISGSVSVGNTTDQDTVYTNSNSASFLSLLAPGSDINSSVPGKGYERLWGTSMAAPHVAGAWALLKQQNPTASVESVLSALVSTGRPVTDTRVAGGVTKPRIKIADAAMAWRRPAFSANWGSAGSGNQQFQRPYGVATDSSGDVYVADTHNNRIQKFTSRGSFIRQWGTQGSSDGQLSLPYSVATDSLGNVYVADFSRVQKFDSNGNFIRPLGSYGTGDGQFVSPRGVATDSSGNVYVADMVNNRIQKFGSNGNFITKWGSEGISNGQFKNPFGVATDSSGNVYVADTNNNRVQKFGSNGNFIASWGGQGSGDGRFDSPNGVATDSSGYVYVTDNNNRVQKFTSSGTFLTKWGSSGTGNGEFDSPWGIATHSSGEVYVTELGNNRIQWFSYNKTSTPADGTPPDPPLINSPAHNSYDTDGNFTVSGTAESDSTVEVFDGATSEDITQADANGDWAIELSGVTESEHTYTAKAADAAGNTSGASNAVRVTVDTVKPKVTVVAPASGKTGVSAATNVTATFSEAMNPATLNKTTVKLVKKGTTTPVKATVTYNATTNKVTLDPSASLQRGATYTASITTGAKDRAGNALAANKVWRFTVR